MVSWKEAAKVLAVFVKFAQQCSCINCIQNEFLLQRGKICKQVDIRNYFKVSSQGKKVQQTSVQPIKGEVVVNWMVTSEVVTPQSCDALFMLRCVICYIN